LAACSVFLDTLDHIERSTQRTLTEQGTDAIDLPPVHPARETRAALEKLISRMEGLGTEFDKLMERSGWSPTITFTCMMFTLILYSPVAGANGSFEAKK
jgi:hypothetical protein